MKVEQFLTKKEREQRDQKNSTLFINNILGDVDIKAFVNNFEAFGTVTGNSFNKSQFKDNTIQRGTITFATTYN